ncbi:unnamed protein product [Discosporangium mesarthrocarpum]
MFLDLLRRPGVGVGMVVLTAAVTTLLARKAYTARAGGKRALQNVISRGREVNGAVEVSIEQSGCLGCDCAETVTEPGPLEGTMKSYERHVILCTGAAEWPRRIEVEKGSVATTLHGLCVAAGLIDIKSKGKKTKDKNDRSSDTAERGFGVGGGDEGGGAITVGDGPTSAGRKASGGIGKTRVIITACTEPSRGPPGTMDIIVYPEGLIYTLGGVSRNSKLLEAFVQAQLVEGRVDDALQPRPTPFAQLVLVCTHGSRDKRCGRVGPQVLEAMAQELTKRGKTEKEVALRGSSHIGGHRFAGVLIVYPQGDWYGQLSKRNAAELVDRCILGDGVMKKNWRGNMSTG